MIYLVSYLILSFVFFIIIVVEIITTIAKNYKSLSETIGKSLKNGSIYSNNVLIPWIINGIKLEKVLDDYENRIFYDH